MVQSAEVINERALEASDDALLLEVIDNSSDMSGNLRAAADIVTTPGFEQALTTWAEAAEQSAQLQRDLLDDPSTPVDQVTARVQNTVTLLDEATETLAQGCPRLSAILAPSKG